MVSYKIGISNKNEGRIIDLSKKIVLKDLKLLDIFTSEFMDENELKMYLFNQELINEEELKQKINVMYKNNGKVKKIPIIYKDMKPYLDIIYLQNKLKSLSNDIDFLEKLSNYYSNGSTKYNKQGLNVSDIRIYLNDVRSNGGNVFESTLLLNALEDLFEKEVIKSIDRSTGELTIKYRGLRNLAILIYKYEKKLEKENNKQEWIQNSLFDEREIAYQTNQYFLEENDKYGSNLSSDGDPDFPYNSEEEEMYNNYIENLKDEYHPHTR